MKESNIPTTEESSLQAVFQSLGIAVLALDLALHITAFSPSVTRIFNIGKNSIGKKFSDVDALLISAFPVNLVKEVLASATSRETEIITASNQTFLTTLAPCFSKNKEAGGIIVTFADITARKAEEERLKTASNQLNDALESTKAGWGNWNWITGEGAWNQAGKNLMDFYSEDDANYYGGWLQRIHPDDREFIKQRILETIANKGDFNADYRIITKEGAIRYINATGKVKYDEKGWALSSTGLITDITERKRAENRLSFLAEIENDLIHSDGIKDIMQMVALKIGSFLQLSCCVFVKVDERQNKAEAAYCWHLPDAEITCRSDEFIDWEFKRLAKNRTKFVVDDVSSDERINQRDYTKLGIGSFLSIPILQKNQWHFFLSVSHAKAHHWQDDEIQLIEQLASHIWTTLERRDAEIELRASEEKFRTVFSSIDDSFSLCEIITNDEGKAVDYRWLDVNPAFEKLTGLNWEKVAGKTALTVIPDIDANWVDMYEKAALHGEPVRFQGTVVSLKKWFDIYATPIGEKGSGRFAAIAKDITDQKLAELNLQNSEERLRLAIEAGNIGTCDWDYDTGYMICNPTRYRMYGMKPQDHPVHLTEFVKHIHPDDVRSMTATVLSKIKSEGKYTVEHRTVLSDNSIRWISDTGEVVEWKDRNPHRIISILVDITDRKTEEQQKDDFFGVASHELKTPVTSIKAYTEVLESLFRDQGNNEAADLMTRLNGQVDRLTSLINYMLDTTRITAGQLLLLEETVDVSEIVKSSVEEMQRTTERHRIVLHPSPLPLVVGDKERLMQVLINLLSNAIKYSPYNTDVIVKTSFQNNQINVSIQDFGLGMSAGTLTRIFQRFFRSDNPTVHTYPGLGLGLYISKEIMKRHNGNITVKSKRGKGSEFTMMLPAYSNS